VDKWKSGKTESCNFPIYQFFNFPML